MAWICAHQAENIKKIVYYSVTPAKYMNRGKNVAVVDIITKRTRQTFFSSYLNTTNSLNEFLGNQQLALVYADSLNRLTASYNEFHTDASNLESAESYDYEFIGSQSSYRTKEGKVKHFGQTMSLSYQHYFGQDLFYVGASYYIYPNKSVTPSEITMADGMGNIAGSRRSASMGRSDTWTVGLFYNHKMRDSRKLTAQATFGRNDWYTNSYLELAMEAPLDYLDYDYESSIKSSGYYGYLGASFEKSCGEDTLPPA